MTKQAVKMAVETHPKTASHEETVSRDFSDPVIPEFVDSGLVDQQEIAILAFEFWQARGRPDGSPEEDWFHAELELQSRRPKTS